MSVNRAWTIGSAGDCDLIIERPSVSGHHCRLEQRTDGDFLEDLASSNGTFVNGHQITSRSRVKREDQIRLGMQVVLPWPENDWPVGTRILLIGRGVETDVKIDDSRVSELHARLIIGGSNGPYWIEDLRSTNGTSINKVGPTIQRSRLLESDQVFFGSLEVPASRLLGREIASRSVSTPILEFQGSLMIVGRNPESGWVINSPVVSGSHARLSRDGAQVFLEDLGSANGTFINGQPVTQGRALIQSGDEIGLGSYRLTLKIVSPTIEPSVDPLMDAGLSIAVDPDEDEPEAGRPRTSIGRVAADSIEPRRSKWNSVGDQRRIDLPWLLWGLVVGLALVLALAVTILFSGSARSPITSENWTQSALTIHYLLFFLALLPIACGALVSLEIGDPAYPRPFRVDLRWSRIAGNLCSGFLACLLILTIVSIGSGLKGSWLGMLGLITSGMIVGMALGLCVQGLTSRLSSAIVVMTIIFVVAGLLGGDWPNRTRLPLPVRVAADGLPSRWVFEGLLVLESDRRPTWRAPSAPERSSSEYIDMAESIFPAETYRVGPRACFLGLLITLVWPVAGILLVQRFPRAGLGGP